MDSQTTDERTLFCPNCQALNPPRTLVCASCGVNLADFRAALPRIQTLQEEYIALHHEQLAEDVSAVLETEMAQGRKRWQAQMRILLVVGALLAVLVVIGSILYGYQQKVRREQLATAYEQATECLATEDYQCARDKLIAIWEDSPEYEGVRDTLREARFKLAQQYVAAGQWESAVAELDALLKDQPDDPEALALLENTYNRWIEDAVGRGEWITVFQVQLQRDARFAEK